jgi:hypothetical protein
MRSRNSRPSRRIDRCGPMGTLNQVMQMVQQMTQQQGTAAAHARARLIRFTHVIWHGGAKSRQAGLAAEVMGSAGASIPIRQDAILASRVLTCPRDHRWLKTIAPRLSRPTTWNEFLPISRRSSPWISEAWDAPVFGAPRHLQTRTGQETAGPFHESTVSVVTIRQKAKRPGRTGAFRLAHHAKAYQW